MYYTAYLNAEMKSRYSIHFFTWAHLSSLVVLVRVGSLAGLLTEMIGFDSTAFDASGGTLEEGLSGSFVSLVAMMEVSDGSAESSLNSAAIGGGGSVQSPMVGRSSTNIGSTGGGARGAGGHPGWGCRWLSPR